MLSPCIVVILMLSCHWWCCCCCLELWLLLLLPLPLTCSSMPFDCHFLLSCFWHCNHHHHCHGCHCGGCHCGGCHCSGCHCSGCHCTSCCHCSCCHSTAFTTGCLLLCCSQSFFKQQLWSPLCSLGSCLFEHWKDLLNFFFLQLMLSDFNRSYDQLYHFNAKIPYLFIGSFYEQVGLTCKSENNFGLLIA